MNATNSFTFTKRSRIFPYDCTASKNARIRVTLRFVLDFRCRSCMPAMVKWSSCKVVPWKLVSSSCVSRNLKLRRASSKRFMVIVDVLFCVMRITSSKEVRDCVHYTIADAGCPEELWPRSASGLSLRGPACWLARLARLRSAADGLCAQPQYMYMQLQANVGCSALPVTV